MRPRIEFIRAEQVKHLDRAVLRALENFVEVFAFFLRHKPGFQRANAARRPVQDIETVPAVFHDARLLGNLAQRMMHSHTVLARERAAARR
jgi:hypothetical protein